MQDQDRPLAQLVRQQRLLAEKRLRPTKGFIEFRKEEIEQSIPARFEQQVRSNGTRLAVKTRSRELSYDALNRAANRVAHALLSTCGGASQRPVAVLLEQGPQAIAATLGVWKAGQIYLPLDPALPRARTAHVLADSQACVLVTDQKGLARARELAAGQLAVINLDEHASGADDNPQRAIAADDLAYLVYTSGSTGQPKGVVNNHRNLLHDCMRVTNFLCVCAEDRWTLLSSGTSQTIKNITGALLNGAALYPVNVKEEGAGSLAGRLMRQEITVYSSSTTLFREFAGSLSGDRTCPNLRLLYVGGEPVYREDIELARRHFPRAVFVQGLAASEMGSVCLYRVDQDSLPDGRIPVGYPLEDLDVLLLDDTGQEVGVGGVGEIVVKGRYLSLGYWRRPDLTEAAFQRDPQGGPAWVYRTGDLGRRLPDGCLEYRGRKDLQIKIRGYRVEITEVEMALLNLPGIREAAVVAREDRPGNQRLVAYLVPTTSAAPTAPALRRLLAARLPACMVPSVFVLLHALPRTANDKLDRRALPGPDTGRPALETPFVVPRTPIEARLVAIWSEVLGLAAVGVFDPFFDLGGDSLRAMQILSRLREAFQVELSPRLLLTSASTVAELAQAVSRQRLQQADPQQLAALVRQVSQLSDDEVRALLAGQMDPEQGPGPA